MPEDDDVLESLLESLRSLHAQFYGHLTQIDQRTIAKRYTKEQLVDIGFICREAEQLLDDWRKDCKARKEKAARLLSEETLTASLANDTTEDTVHGRRAYAVCNMEVVPALPPRDLENPDYIALCEHFKVPKELLGTKVFKLDFDTVKKLVTEASSGQRKAIPGLGKSFPQYTAVFTRKRKK